MFPWGVQVMVRKVCHYTYHIFFILLSTFFFSRPSMDENLQELIFGGFKCLKFHVTG